MKIRRKLRKAAGLHFTPHDHFTPIFGIRSKEDQGLMEEMKAEMDVRKLMDRVREDLTGYIPIFRFKGLATMVP